MTDPLSPTVCDNRSVGVIITDPRGRFLVFDRNTFPVGTAPCAGHIDEHGSDEQAAAAEASEELGLTLSSLELVVHGWRNNRCRREPGPLGTGHRWSVFRAAARGRLDPSPRETRNARWIDQDTLHGLYLRTLALADGTVTEQQFEQRPGLEPVWPLWFALVGALQANAAELLRIESLTRHHSGRVGPLCPDCDGTGSKSDKACASCSATGIDFTPFGPCHH